MKRWILIVVVLTGVILMTGCLPMDGTHSENPAGFFWGIWHGWMAPISLIMGLLNQTTRIYEPNNVGWLYDLGFYAAVISGFGGFSLSRKRADRREK